jgi:hypothetical protein
MAVLASEDLQATFSHIQKGGTDALVAEFQVDTGVGNPRTR